MSAFLLPLRPNRCPHRTAHNQASRAPQPRHSLQSLHSSCWSRSWSKRLASSWPQAPLCRGNRTSFVLSFHEHRPERSSGEHVRPLGVNPSSFARAPGEPCRELPNLSHVPGICCCRCTSRDQLLTRAQAEGGVLCRRSAPRHSRSAPKSGPERAPCFALFMAPPLARGGGRSGPHDSGSRGPERIPRPGPGAGPWTGQNRGVAPARFWVRTGSGAVPEAAAKDASLRLARV